MNLTRAKMDFVTCCGTACEKFDFHGHEAPQVNIVTSQGPDPGIPKKGLSFYLTGRGAYNYAEISEKGTA